MSSSPYSSGDIDRIPRWLSFSGFHDGLEISKRGMLDVEEPKGKACSGGDLPANVGKVLVDAI